MSTENPVILENRRSVTERSLDFANFDRKKMMKMIEHELVASIETQAALMDIRIDIPSVTWTCVAIGREKFAHDGQA